MASNPIRFGLDLTGLSPNNLVINEAHTLDSNVQIRAIAPVYGPYYVNSLSIIDTSGNVALADTQFNCVELQQDATVLTGQEICSLILITDPTVSNDIKINYQVLGGTYQNSAETVIQAYETVLQDARSIDWANVLNKPSAYPPSLHEHLLTDVYGFQSIVASLERVRNAIILSDVPTLDAVVAWVQQNWGNVENNPVINSVDIAAGVAIRKYVTYDTLLQSLAHLKIPIPIISGGTGGASSAQALNNLLPPSPSAAFVLTSDGPGSYYWSAGTAVNGSTQFQVLRSSKTEITATSGQTLFTSSLYTLGDDQLRVYKNGIRLNTTQYSETSTTSFTLVTGATAGDIIIAEVDAFVFTVTAQMIAAALGYTPIGSFTVTAPMIDNALGYTPIGGITGAEVIAALGFTPLPAPDAFQFNVISTSITLGSGASWVLPANCIMINGYVQFAWTSNTAALSEIHTCDAVNNTIYSLTVGNESGNDGGSGSTWMLPFTIPISSNASYVLLNQIQGGNPAIMVIKSYVVN